MAESDISVGARCVCDGFYGTVRFIGSVPPTNGVWLGVEWDDPSRGKHSGEHEGVVYFQTQVAGSGSFVRPKKVSFGCSFMNALRNVGEAGLVILHWEQGAKKYGTTDEERGEIVVGGQSVELVGMEKIAKRQGEYDKLLEISLRDMSISSAGAPGEIAAALSNIRELNLGENPLIASWRVMDDIASQLPHLETLDLSENIGLRHVPADLMRLSSPYQSLRTLYLNRIGLPWKHVSWIMPAMPRLEALHVCGNHINSLRFEGDMDKSYIPNNLQLLNFEKNYLCEWSDILRLEPQLRKLKNLILTDNDLSVIFLEESPAVHFPALKSLSLSGNPISEWSSVTSLDSISTLTELKIKAVPLLKDETGFSARQLLIAHLSHISSLNRSNVSTRERVLAERYYLKRFGRQWLDCESDKSGRISFICKHPRFPELVQVHGLPDEVLLGQKPVTSALKHGLISISVRCPDCPEQPQLSKKLPATMTVQKLKGLLARAYKVSSTDQRLSYLDSRGDCEIELDDDLKQLDFFSIQSGDTILLRW